MSAVGLKPIDEVQFADYIYPGFNQLVTEISKSCYLSYGKFPVSMILRVPIGAYGGGGPYHSGSIESTLLSIKGIKVCYPSNAADIKGLMKKRRCRLITLSIAFLYQRSAIYRYHLQCLLKSNIFLKTSLTTHIRGLYSRPVPSFGSMTA